MDIKAKVEELVNKIKGSKDLTEKFKDDPKGTVKDLVGIDLPTDQLDNVVDAVKAKLDLDSASSVISKIGGLFKK